jgi:hypothetical protein
LCWKGCLLVLVKQGRFPGAFDGMALEQASFLSLPQLSLPMVESSVSAAITTRNTRLLRIT